MKSIRIDEASSLPAFQQIKEQIKLAYAVGTLKEGDVLPSIRVLARQLGVGDAVVRRAYEELTTLGFLSTEPRKHLMVADTLAKPPHLDKLAGECTEECGRLIEWARRKRLSSISLARLALARATQAEMETPSYVYVDRSSVSAKKFADVIARAWEVPVLGLSLSEVARLSAVELSQFICILVNSYRYETLVTLLRRRRKRGIYNIKMTVHPRIVRRIHRQPAGSRVLLVLPDDDALRLGSAVVAYLQEEVGDKVRQETAAFSEIPELAETARNGRYSLVIVSHHIWDLVPEKARRLSNVIPNENQMDMESLERVRVHAGVIV